MTLTDFLLARIAEDEEVAQAEWRRVAGAARRNGKTTARRRLAECEAKRQIVDRSLGPVAHAGQGIERGAVLRLLAAVYADHPDYRTEWPTHDSAPH